MSDASHLTHAFETQLGELMKRAKTTTPGNANLLQESETERDANEDVSKYGGQKLATNEAVHEAHSLLESSSTLASGDRTDLMAFSQLKKHQEQLQQMNELVIRQKQSIRNTEAAERKLRTLITTNKAILSKNERALKAAGEQFLKDVQRYTKKLLHNSDDMGFGGRHRHSMNFRQLPGHQHGRNMRRRRGPIHHLRHHSRHSRHPPGSLPPLYGNNQYTNPHSQGYNDQYNENGEYER